MISRFLRPAALTASLALAACGGGGGGSATPTAMLPGSTATPAVPAGGSGTLSFKITIPAANAQGASRAPRFNSPSTASVAVTLAGGTTPLATVNLSASAPGCTASGGTTTCTVSVNAPAGNDTFVISTFDGTNGTGHQLSTTRVPATIAASTTTSIPLVLNGTVATVTVALGTSSVPVGVAAQVSVTVLAYDSGNNLIIGPGNYSTPITLTDSDATGATTLSSTSVTAPGTNATLVYNGNSLGLPATITPSVSGVSNVVANAATFTPSGTAATAFTTVSPVDEVDALAEGFDGNMWFTSYGGVAASLDNISPTGNVTINTTGVPSSYASGLVAGADGSLYYGNDNGTVGQMTTSGVFTASPNVNGPCGKSTCGGITQMVFGPDARVWFSDAAGYFGVVDTQINVQEFDPTALTGWQTGPPAPNGLAFDANRNLYLADGNGYIDQIVFQNGTPTSVAQVPVPCGGRASDGASGAQTVAVSNDGNVWFTDSCGNIGMIPSTHFTATQELSWSMVALTGNNTFFKMLPAAPSITNGLNVATTWPNELWGTTANDGYVYRVTNLSGVTLAQGPAIVATRPFGSDAVLAFSVAIGPDNNVWVASDSNTGTPPIIARVVYGAPGLSTLGAKRLTAPASHTRVNVPAAIARRTASFRKRN